VAEHAQRLFKKVDFIALPTLADAAAADSDEFEKIGLMEAAHARTANTVPVNFAGNPAVALPIPLRDAEVAVTSLQLIGPPLSEAHLLNAGRLVEAAVKQ
jgi:Asp-tRNA(Asn)/Glu-tRNA(Gln) amidotransferase A subunit family amidase